MAASRVLPPSHMAWSGQMANYKVERTVAHRGPHHLSAVD